VLLGALPVTSTDEAVPPSFTQPARPATTQIPTLPSVQHSSTMQPHSDDTQKGCYKALVQQF